MAFKMKGWSAFTTDDKKNFSDTTKYKHLQAEDARSGIVQDKETGKFYSKPYGHEMDSVHRRNIFDRNIVDVQWYKKDK